MESDPKQFLAASISAQESVRFSGSGSCLGLQVSFSVRSLLPRSSVNLEFLGDLGFCQLANVAPPRRVPWRKGFENSEHCVYVLFPGGAAFFKYICVLLSLNPVVMGFPFAAFETHAGG